jgi:hypothetical protein
VNEFLLPHEFMEGAGVPDEYRAVVSYQVLCAKYCALVEQVMKLTDGEPVRISLERAKEILAMNHATDPRDFVMVVEAKPGGLPGEHVDIRLASVDEVRAANHRYALSRMGPGRN